MAPERAVIFLGPSLPGDTARGLLKADYLPPVRRGDLDALGPGVVVGMIDGVFEHDLAVSPREVRDAVARGVVIYGGSSMGALRAAEVQGVHGVGRVFEWYRDGFVTRDDEVALLFDPLTQHPLTVPTVCVRFAAERLRSMGTIDPNTAATLVAAAEKLSFKDRTYARILKAAGLDSRTDAGDLIAMLQAHDIKARDAQAVLEAIDLHLRQKPPRQGLPCESLAPDRATKRSRHAPPKSEVLIWESGDRVSPEQLHRFLALTGRLFGLAESAGPCSGGFDVNGVQQGAQARFVAAARRWGWMSAEEAGVTLADLGLDRDRVGSECGAAVLAEQCGLEALRSGGKAAASALRARLLLDDMGLKREAMRAAALGWFAARADGEPDKAEIDAAEMTLARLHHVARFEDVISRWARAGLDGSLAQDMTRMLARARRAGKALLEEMRGTTPRPPLTADIGFGLGSCPKPAGEMRFCAPLVVAEHHAREAAAKIGITRIGMIGELGDLGGLHVAQAARPGNAWSSSYGSGKARTSEGAVVGAVMEECEKWAQEHFDPTPELIGSFTDLTEQADLVDPSTLDLPYDSPYRPDLDLGWVPVADLMSGRMLHFPLDPLVLRRGRHDICYSARGARKHLATNGLGAGLSLEEAVLHGLCEYVERHAQRMAELYLSNPGRLGVQPYLFVDAARAAPRLEEIVLALTSRADAVRVLEITGEIKIPTYMAAVVRNGQVAHGFGTHPNSVAAMEAALLEAAQTIASATAGGREDLSIKARSLGRHERPRPSDPGTVWFWMDPDTPVASVAPRAGLTSCDVLHDLVWALDRLREAGVGQVLACDLSPPEIAPVRVVRVGVPGLETNNPFYTGQRARLALLRDMLPRWV
jgi:ribosomal protein S12 methylthiotransferase accessory factor